MLRNELGRAGEDAAATYLSARGYTVLDRNVRSREGEIDLIVARAGVVAFVEVKTRRSRAFGLPGEAVTFTKQRRIRRMAVRYLSEQRAHARAVRFDVIEVTPEGHGFSIRHLEDAF